MNRVEPGRSMLRPYSIILVLLFLAPSLIAQTLDVLDAKISSIDSQITSLNKEYAKLTDLNKARLRRAEEAKSRKDSAAADQELKAAYASTEQLNGINAQLNQLKAQKLQLCSEWQVSYRKTMDDLLAEAEQQKDRKQKADIGRKLQHYQQRNAMLCAENPSLVSTEWRGLQIEQYDGPAEIKQKIQLLEDISRELRVTMAKMDVKYQDSLREQKTKERAQEFVQEGTLFNEGTALITSSRNAPEAAAPVNGQNMEFASQQPGPGENTASQYVLLNDWQTTDAPEQIEKEYKSNRAQLMSLQKDLQTKIEEFQKKAKTLQLP